MIVADWTSMFYVMEMKLEKERDENRDGRERVRGSGMGRVDEE